MTLLYVNSPIPSEPIGSKFDIYIIHNHKLVDRKKYIEDRIPDAKFIQIELDAPELMGRYYKGHNHDAWNKKCLNLWSPIPDSRELSKGEIACTTSHFLAYEKFLQDSSKEYLIILEDDAIFSYDIKIKIQTSLDSMPNNFEAMFIGGGYPHDICLTLGRYKNLLIKHHPATNTAVSYILKRSMVKKIMGQFSNFDLPIDCELAHYLMINNALVCHIDPYFVQEGSKRGHYESSVGFSNRL